MPPSPEVSARERTSSIKAIHSREVLLDAVAKAKTQAEKLSLQKDEASEHANYDLTIAEKRLRLFENEHDPTGAWKGKRFGRDVAKIFDNEFTAEAHGKLVPTEALKQTHMLVVSMGELDRLNREGSHKLGNDAMALTHQQIAKNVEAMILEHEPDIAPEELVKRYDVYRTGGNEFSVIMRGVTAPEGVQGLAAGFDRVAAVSEANKSVEAPPLITNAVSMEEVYEVLNTVRREDGMDDFLSWESGRKTRIAVDIVKDIALTENDILKTRQRLNRFEELVAKAKTSGDEKPANDFYDLYLKKGLGTIFSGEEETMSSFGEAKDTLEQMGAFDESWTPEWQKEKEQIALNEGFKHFRKAKEADRTGEWNLQKQVAEKVKRRYALGEYATSTPSQPVAFEAPKPTSGALVLEQKRQAANVAKQKAEGGHNLLEAKKAEIATLDLQIESARRDGMTGLEERGALYEGLEDALSRNQKVATLFIDMAFLKYFDKVGGREVGDNAIKKAAQILDEVAQDPKWKVKYPEMSIKAYRYAGDEFTLVVEGLDESAIKEIREEIANRAKMAGEVPAAEVGGAYEPTKLSFNIGSSYSKGAADLEQRVQELGLPLHGEPGSKDRINQLAEYAIRFADKEIDISKAMDRFKQLIALINERGSTDAYTQQIMAYSQKAIFGKVGQNRLEDWAKKVAQGDSQSLMREAELDLLEFTIQQKDVELKEKHEQDREIEARIERHIREQYFERRISGLNATIQRLENSIAKIEGENTVLRQTLTQQKATYEEERDKISGLRDRVLGA
jgi:diguanylate cyclase (GGDEF)-like protein